MPSRTIPPGPPGNFFLGNLGAFSRDLLACLLTCAREYGDVASFRLAHVRVYLLSHPHDIESVLVKDHANFVKHSFFWRHVQAVFGKGLLTNEGKSWVRQRRLIQPAFHRERMTSYAQIMVNASEQMAATWQDQEVRDIHQDMMHLTAQIIHATLVESRGPLQVEEIGAMMDVATAEIAHRIRRLVFIPDWVPTPGNLRYGRAVKKLDAFLDGVLEQADSPDLDPDGLLASLCDAKDWQGHPLTRQQIRDNISTLFLAGHETTALALSWTWYLLSQYPAVEATLLEELRAVLGGRSPMFEDIPRLPYAEMVIREAMRLYPPAYVLGRETRRPYTVGGYEIPTGGTILMSQWVVHRDPRFFDEPESFDPERWAGDLADRLPPFAYFPFRRWAAAMRWSGICHDRVCTVIGYLGPAMEVFPCAGSPYSDADLNYVKAKIWNERGGEKALNESVMSRTLISPGGRKKY